MNDSISQFQIFDDVLYIQEGIITRVVGYLWLETMDELPKVTGYHLACGCTVPLNAIKRIEPEEPKLTARKRFRL